MGYYSDVGIVFKKDEYVKFLNNYEKRMEKYKEDPDKIKTLEEMKKVIEEIKQISSNKEDVLLYFDDIKWYDYDEEYFCDIVEIMNIIKEDLEENNFFYIRKGEDLDDIEELGYYYDNEFNLNIQTQIVYNSPPSPSM